MNKDPVPQPSQAVEDPFLVNLSKGTACAHQHLFPLCARARAHYSRPSSVVLWGSHSATELV